jgi:hypothetical protein
MSTTVLVASRGETAVRASHAAYEPGGDTVAVFPVTGPQLVHRITPDESHQVGNVGHPGPDLPARWCGDHRASYCSPVAVEQIPCGPAGS